MGDKLIRATDLDALGFRVSANAKGYFVPPDRFAAPLVASYAANLQYCTDYTQLLAGRTVRAAVTPKMPLINRGTYLRLTLVDRLVAGFVQEHGTCQIVALGAGSDTRPFRMLPSWPAGLVLYTEVDFPDLVRLKKLACGDPALAQVIGWEGDSTVASRQDMEQLDPALHTTSYHLVALDLREIEQAGATAFAHLDKGLPTLVLSECVLCYLPPAKVRAVLRFCHNTFLAVAVAMYDPMALDDAFGQTMAQNLARRGLNLECFLEWPNSDARQRLFAEEGYSLYLTDMARIGGYMAGGSWLDQDEKTRLDRIELIDEVEELSLLFQHYGLIYAEKNLQASFVQALPWALHPALR